MGRTRAAGHRQPVDWHPMGDKLSGKANGGRRAAPPSRGARRRPRGSAKASWSYGVRLLLRQIGAHQVTDMAATMTYYLVLSVFPLLLVLVSLLNLLGSADPVVPALEQMLGSLLPADVMDVVSSTIRGFLTSGGAGWMLAVGVVTALWSASNYIGAFIRAMNRVYGVTEGRTMVRRRALQLGLTLMLAASIGILGTTLVLSEGVVRWLADHLRLGDGFVHPWTALRLPLIGLIGMVLLAVLYYFAPNVRRPRRRVASPGALVALVLSGVIVWGFGIYLNVFNGAGSYAKTYGALAGVIIGLFLMWLINVMILIGAEVDAALEQVIQLRSGLDASGGLLLPARDGSQARRSRTGQGRLRDDAIGLRDAALAAGATPSAWYRANALTPEADPLGPEGDAEPLWRHITGRIRRVQAAAPPEPAGD